jgi:hypothetical protein
MGSIPNPLGMGSGTIHLETHAKGSNSQILRAGQPLVVLLAGVADERPGAPTRKIGMIRSTIIDISDTSLALDQEVSAEVSKALRNQLAADGFRVVSDRSAAHDFEVEAKLKDFHLDIVDEDRLGIAVDVVLRDVRTGDALWAGSVAETGHRFAGIAGDSRATIVSYLVKGVDAWSAKASANIREALLKSYPKTIALAERRELPAAQTAGVTTMQEAQPREAAASTAVSPMMGMGTPAPSPIVAVESPVVGPAPGATGTFALTTVPAKAKVYIDDVYYGVSPIKLDLPPGVIAFRFKLDGYKTIDQKVSVRRGETTELEVKFEK